MQCAACHTTALHQGYDPQADAYATTAAAMNVSCEACHGAGSRHAAWAMGEGRPEESATKGLALRLASHGGPGRWAMDRSRGIARWDGPPRAAGTLEVCAGCHARRREIAADPPPGMPFLDAHAPELLDPGLYQPNGAILGEVFEWGSFQQSRMHRAGVTCTDCHQPHSARLRADGNALCSQCHASERFDVAAHHRHAEGSAGAQCTACHMASRTYMGVHVRHDHSFRVPRPDLSTFQGTSDACTDCHKDRDAAWAAARIADWHGEERRREPHWGTAIAAGRAGAPGGAGRLLALAEDRDAPAVARATALSLLANLPPAPAMAQALVAAAGDPDPLVRFATAAAFATVPPAQRAAALARLVADPVRAVRLEAVRALAPVPDAALPPEARAARNRAMAEYMAAARHNADRPEALASLGDLLMERGRSVEAEAEYRAALHLDAAFVSARLGFADLLRRTGREAEAEAALREGIVAAPGAAALHHALGLSLARQRRGAEALDALARAAQFDAGDPRFSLVYGVALNSMGRPREAVEALRNALARYPGNREILLMLALLARDAGALATARDYAQQALAADPDGRDARQLLQSLAGAAVGGRGRALRCRLAGRLPGGPIAAPIARGGRACHRHRGLPRLWERPAVLGRGRRRGAEPRVRLARATLARISGRSDLAGTSATPCHAGMRRRATRMAFGVSGENALVPQPLEHLLG
ncbi:tetratricopeptide repeat protein [Dankookia sp. P2]|uniref:cytochrome c3 family protein n=1 Tax=Dankookia sp. P2 TaxID=3423955 RepID=UPI003D67A449